MVMQGQDLPSDRASQSSARDSTSGQQTRDRVVDLAEGIYGSVLEIGYIIVSFQWPELKP